LKGLCLFYPGGLSINASFSIVERYKAELKSRGLRFEAKVEILGVDEQRVSYDRVLVVSGFFLPIFEALAGESDFLARSVPVKVVVHINPDLRPGPG